MAIGSYPIQNEDPKIFILKRKKNSILSSIGNTNFFIFITNQ